MVGTWKAADWAISFYEKHGFSLVDEEEKNRLLKKYGSIPGRQAAASVVLVDEKYKKSYALQERFLILKMPVRDYWRFLIERHRVGQWHAPDRHDGVLFPQSPGAAGDDGR